MYVFKYEKKVYASFGLFYTLGSSFGVGVGSGVGVGVGVGLGIGALIANCVYVWESIV